MKESHRVQIKFIWIPHELGGHKTEPSINMKLEIRWQKYLKEHFELTRITQCHELDFDKEKNQWLGLFCLYGKSLGSPPIPHNWLQEGELVELVSAYKVFAVGKIIKEILP